MTHDAFGTPGDPINIAVVGTPAELAGAFDDIGWCEPDAVTAVTGVAMAATIATNQPYRRAPISNLYYQGRAQDLCFQQVEGSPLRRHHVRLWRSGFTAADGRPVWLGAAVYDNGLRLSRLPNLVMHRIDPDLDAERDKLVEQLRAAGRLQSVAAITVPGAITRGYNATGDEFYTDGNIAYCTLRPAEVIASVAREPAWAWVWPMAAVPR